MLPWILAQLRRRKKTAMAIAVCLVAVFFVWTALPLSASAESPSGDTFGLAPIRDTGFFGSADIRVIIARIINAALGFLGVVAFVLVLYAGFVIMTAGGNEEKVAEGKKILVNAVIGLAIILSAYTIVSFIIRALAGATGTGFAPGLGDRRGRESFAASGALGDMVRDHYPFRDQLDVPRNTRVSVTFNEAIDPSSIIENTNGTVNADNDPVYGDCPPGADGVVNWETDCDRVRTNAVALYPTGDAGSPLSMAALGTAEGEAAEYFTFVFVPLSALGNDAAPVEYSVDLTNDILKADADRTRAFDDDSDRGYTWQFETGTNFDFTPPVVAAVYPEPGDVNVPRNTLIQIRFSEAVDPSTVQGASGADSAFTNLLFSDGVLSGNWRVASGYRTVEFVPDTPCAERSSCGDVMYCLPANADLDVLARTAQLLNCPFDNQGCLDSATQNGLANQFAGLPLTGVTDMAGNALDGNGSLDNPVGVGIPNGKPIIQVVGELFASEFAPDNAYWGFSVGSAVDRTAPYIVNIVPGIDAERVSGDQAVAITFSARLWEATLSGFDLVERGLEDALPFWHRVTGSLDASDRTVASVDHRVFGPNGDDAYYYPVVPSSVKSLTQNCLYPGRGPDGTVSECAYDDQTGAGTGCVPVVLENSLEDTGCVYANPGSPDDILQSDISSCIEELNSVSPI